MNCQRCNKVMEKGLYICSTNTYDICDLNGNVLYSWELHDLEPTSEEIGSSCNVDYCLDCHILIM